jgi:hypothetical protein
LRRDHHKQRGVRDRHVENQREGKGLLGFAKETKDLTDLPYYYHPFYSEQTKHMEGSSD